jgi:hypothetical protein
MIKLLVSSLWYSNTMPAAIHHFVSLRIIFSKVAMLKSASFTKYENEKKGNFSILNVFIDKIRVSSAR